MLSGVKRHDMRVWILNIVSRGI